MSIEHQKHADELELQDRIVISAARDGQAGGGPSGGHVEFEVVGIIEDSESGANYAVCYSEAADEFIVTDRVGTLLEDEPLAQEILNDFLEQAGDATAEDER